MSGRVYDMQGNDVTDQVKGAGLNGISIGAQAWEFLHPEAVQAEFAALGQPVPSKAGVMTGAVNNTLFNPLGLIQDEAGNIGRSWNQATSAAGDLGAAISDAGASLYNASVDALDQAETASKWLIVGLVAFAVLEVMKEVRK